jgi:hypothetical protein
MNGSRAAGRREEQTGDAIRKSQRNARLLHFAGNDGR